MYQKPLEMVSTLIQLSLNTKVTLFSLYIISNNLLNLLYFTLSLDSTCLFSSLFSLSLLNKKQELIADKEGEKYKCEMTLEFNRNKINCIYTQVIQALYYWFIFKINLLYKFSHKYLSKKIY